MVRLSSASCHNCYLCIILVLFLCMHYFWSNNFPPLSTLHQRGWHLSLICPLCSLCDALWRWRACINSFNCRTCSLFNFAIQLGLLHSAILYYLWLGLNHWSPGHLALTFDTLVAGANILILLHIGSQLTYFLWAPLLNPLVKCCCHSYGHLPTLLFSCNMKYEQHCLWSMVVHGGPWSCGRVQQVL